MLSMKKILLLLLGLILIPFSAFAISLSEIQSDPGRYAKVAEGQTTTMYVDSYSIQSLRYAPPYYTIQGKTMSHIQVIVLRNLQLYLIMTMIEAQ